MLNVKKNQSSKQRDAEIMEAKMKELRIARGLSQKDVAKVMGVTSQTILNWENNLTDPKLKQLIQLADYYEVSVDYLIGHKENSDQVVTDFFSELTQKCDFDSLINDIREYCEKVLRKKE
jgi:transcriptional regulator with XRE-family HTH domain